MLRMKERKILDIKWDQGIKQPITWKIANVIISEINKMPMEPMDPDVSDMVTLYKPIWILKISNSQFYGIQEGFDPPTLSYNQNA